MSRFKNVHPLMIYLPLTLRGAIKAYSKRHRTTVSYLMREAALMRMASDDRYTAGWNDAIDSCMRIIQENQAGKMMFPSGRSFSQMICEELVEMRRSPEKVEHEKTG